VSGSASFKALPAGDVLESSAARKLRLNCESAELTVEAVPAREVRRSLINTVTKRSLLIENEQAQRAIVADALANGVPIVHSAN
jgi:hypothetical protein